MESLELDINCKKLHLASKLETVANTLEGEDAMSCWQKNNTINKNKPNNYTSVHKLNLDD